MNSNKELSIYDSSDFTAAKNEILALLKKQHTIQDSLKYSDWADAARLVSDSTQQANDASVLKILIEHDLGRMLSQTEKNKGVEGVAGPGRGHKKKPEPKLGSGFDTIPTYKQMADHMGLKERKFAHRMNRAQKLYKAEPDQDKLEALALASMDLDEILPQKIIAAVIRESERQKNASKLQEIAANSIDAPEGVFDVIVIDPPWPVKKVEMDWRPKHVDMPYETMSVEQLKEWTMPLDFAADDCHLFLWTTEKLLPKGFEIIESWELKYVLTFVWHKPNGFQPLGLPTYNCEFCIYARKGNPEFITTKAFFTCFNGPQGEHSRKPDEFYDMIRRVTGGRRLDMFNRRKIQGFTGWGNQAK